MIFEKEEEFESLTNVLVSENKRIFIGIYRVMYGYRVRSGFVGSACCELDWCGGNNWDDVQRLYSLAVSVLSNREESRNAFDGIPPHSKIKPFFLDKEFTETVIRLAGKDFKSISLPKPNFFSFSLD